MMFHFCIFETSMKHFKKIENSSIKFLTPIFGVIDTKPKQQFNLPFALNIKGDHSDELIKAEVIGVIPFDGIIPDHIAYFCEFKDADEATPELLEKFNCRSVNDLCFYQYRIL